MSFKKIFFAGILSVALLKSNAQKIESIQVDLYTDSLKKGTYNYININGKMAGGGFIPLDTTELIFTSSDGKFFGNSLYVEPGFKKDKIDIKAILKSNTSMYKEFTMYIKKPDEKLKSLDELMDDWKTNSKSKKKKG